MGGGGGCPFIVIYSNLVTSAVLASVWLQSYQALLVDGATCYFNRAIDEEVI